MDRTTVDHLLSTTRSVRKRLDLTRPVEPELIEQCLDLAIQAPTGSNRQRWHFVVITDPGVRQAIAEIYRRSFAEYIGVPTGPTGATMQRGDAVRDSAVYLAEHFHEVPVLVLFCYEGRVERAGAAAQASLYGSILPAAWSFMLALRSRGLGSVWTTLHLRFEQEVAELLNLPSKYTQAALIPVAYYLGEDFQPAQRTPAKELTSWNHFGVRRSAENEPA